jgi:hypothetical protein
MSVALAWSIEVGLLRALPYVPAWIMMGAGSLSYHRRPGVDLGVRAVDRGRAGVEEQQFSFGHVQ